MIAVFIAFFVGMLMGVLMMCLISASSDNFADRASKALEDNLKGGK